MKSLVLSFGENALYYFSYFAGDAGIEIILTLDFFLFFRRLFYGLFLRNYILVSLDNALGVDVPKVGYTLCDYLCF